MQSTPLRAATSFLASICMILSLSTVASAAGVGATSPRNGELDLFFRHDGDGTASDPNADSLVMMRRIDGAWRSPLNLGGYIHKDSEISATSRANGVIDIVVRWTDNTLRSRTWTRDTGWGAWVTVASGITAGPSISSRPSTGYVYAAWRDANGRLSISGRSATGSWVAPVQFPWTPKTGSGPSITMTPTGGSIYYTGSDPQNIPTMPEYIYLTADADPLVLGNWSQQRFYSAYTALFSTPNNGVVMAGAMRDGATGVIKRWQPSIAPNREMYLEVGTDVAGASNQRPGESTIPNTPISLWSQRFVLTAGQQADMIWRTQNGCFAGRIKTDPAVNAAWNIPAKDAAFPAHPGTARCEWPGRTGTLPLFKRVDPGEWDSMLAARQAWSFEPTSTMTAMNWYSSRDSALMINQGSNLETSWAPRQWHPNAWIYRKSTSYGDADGLHTAAGTSGYFLRAKDDGHLLAINYGCNTNPAAGRVGCSQPLLNVSLPAAREFWLRGPSTAVENAGDCDMQRTVSGALDLLACTSGDYTEQDIPGNAKGLWLDDVLPRLADPTNPNGASLVADQVTGQVLTNAQAVAKLPITQDQWESGIATMLTDLRAGINTLKSQKILRPDQGKVAMNYKWFTYDFGWKGTSPQISSNAAAVKIIQAVDLVDIESGAVDANLHGGVASSAWTLLRQGTFVDQVHGLGRNVIQEKVDCGEIGLPECQDWDSARSVVVPLTAATDTAHRIAAQYNLAWGLLTYSAGDMIGDINDYVGHGFDGYQSDLGAATSSRGPSNAGYPAGAQQRTFERGRVVVIPPEPPVCAQQSEYGCQRSDGLVHVTIPAGLRWRPQGSNTLTAVGASEIALAPKRGAVLLTS